MTTLRRHATIMDQMRLHDEIARVRQWYGQARGQLLMRTLPQYIVHNNGTLESRYDEQTQAVLDNLDRLCEEEITFIQQCYQRTFCEGACGSAQPH